jgi:pyrroline-5-carboxylate reductase
MKSGTSDSPGAGTMRRWGFIGSGKMATALIKGMLQSGIAPVEEIRASDPLASARSLLEAETGVTVYDSNLPVVQHSHVVVLAVKPQSMRQVLANVRSVVTADHLVVSVAAGITIASIVQGLEPGVRVIRVMPNTPALVGEGASAYALGPGVRPEDERLVKSFLESVGQSVGVAESLLDAVTGLSGSGPAFVYLMIEALSDGGVRAGLPRDVATLLASQTVLGAARMVRDTGLHPGVLKDQVASPGGTTIAGLQALERAAVRGALIDAVEAATRRSAELGALATSAGAESCPEAPR